MPKFTIVKSRRSSPQVTGHRNEKPLSSTKQLSPRSYCGTWHFFTVLSVLHVSLLKMSSCWPNRSVLEAQKVLTAGSLQPGQAKISWWPRDYSLIRPGGNLSIKPRQSQKVCQSQHKQTPSLTSAGHYFRYIRRIQLNLLRQWSTTYPTRVDDGHERLWWCFAINREGPAYRQVRRQYDLDSMLLSKFLHPLTRCRLPIGTWLQQPAHGHLHRNRSVVPKVRVFIGEIFPLSFRWRRRWLHQVSGQ